MIDVGFRQLSLSDFERIVLNDEAITLHAEAMQKISATHVFLKDFSRNKIIYGINTGFGPMAQYRIEDKDIAQLQINLIRSHCAGSGPLMADSIVRGILLCRLNTLLLGYSGVHPSVIYQLAYFINNGLIPAIHEHGSVGASGDLVQLAQVALALIGEGQIKVDQQWTPSAEVFARYNLKPIDIVAREGLGIINGTAGMTGIGLVNLIRAKQLEKLAVLASCMINEIVGSFDDHFSQALNEVKLHEGQRLVAAAMRRILEGSKCIRKRDHIYYDNVPEHEVFTDKVQEYYSLRCVPQVLSLIHI